jgi:hypothetical protein
VPVVLARCGGAQQNLSAQDEPAWEEMLGLKVAVDLGGKVLVNESPWFICRTFQTTSR